MADEYLLDIPHREGVPDFAGTAFQAMKRWNDAGIPFKVYNESASGGAFIFDTAANRDKAEQLIADLRAADAEWWRAFSCMTPDLAAAFAAKCDRDLRIFLHQLCEISAILGTPYDADFHAGAGRFQWRDGAVMLLAGPEERTVLLIDINKIPREPTGAALQEFAARCSIRVGRA